MKIKKHSFCFLEQKIKSMEINKSLVSFVYIYIYIIDIIMFLNSNNNKSIK